MSVDAGLVVGTRPSFIMAAPIVRAIDAAGIALELVHTGQHYSDDMDATFFESLDLRAPDVRLARAAEARSPARQIADILVGMEDWVVARRPRVVIVLGDTNSNFAAAVAARKQGAPVWHVEAGERAYDKSTMEEQNRVMIDHIASLLLCTNDKSRRNLLREGVDDSVIAVVGNPIVDSLLANLERADAAVADEPALRESLETPFWLMTLHRQETVDDPEKLQAILHGLGAEARAAGRRIVFPMHPRTRANAARFGLLDDLLARPEFLIRPAIGYLPFIAHLKRAELCLTDSGGVQQEAAILSAPTVTLMDATPWPETVEAGVNVLAPATTTDWARPIARARAYSRRKTLWDGFGDGRTGEKIAALLRDRLSRVDA